MIDRVMSILNASAIPNSNSNPSKSYELALNRWALNLLTDLVAMQTRRRQSVGFSLVRPTN